ncbi:MAG TPA: hypothetical protein VIY72_02080 [Acidimicrobiales bacterium]
MKPGPVAKGLAVVYALVDAAVIVAPAVSVRATGQRVGIEGEYDVDLLLASVIIGTIHAVIAWRRLVDEERAAERAIDVWLASIDALVVLAFCSTFLITAVLLGFTDIHALLAARGAPVVLLWAAMSLVAVVLSEVTGRLVYRWLEPAHPVEHHLLHLGESQDERDSLDEPESVSLPRPPA